MKRINTMHTLRRNFTLIELLVVIAIIAILAGMLLPALNNARERATIINCTSNFKQVALYASLYMNDENGKFPIHYSKDFGGTWIPRVKDYFPKNMCWVKNKSNPTGTNASKGFLACPGLFKVPSKTGDGCYAYALNVELFGGSKSILKATAEGLVNTAQIKNPSGKLMFGEPTRDNGGGYYLGSLNGSTLSKAEGQYPRHGEVMTMSFVDGHAEARSRSQIPQDATIDPKFWGHEQ